ncbi:MAG: T9SS type A sorting domain-containing protein [Bacteroidetes bacterium]|nr:T9SS type A sorting domain-containing protein [Bacteroidota bacterium]
MIFKLKILFFFLVIFVTKNYAQNLVPVPQFEKTDTVICAPPPTITGIIIDVPPWFEYYSADYYNVCDTSNYWGVPQNIIGYQEAHSARGYIGLYAYYQTVFSREYIEVQLASPLVSAQTYYVQFFVSLGDTMQYAIENIGALFTDTLFDPYPSSVWTPGIPQVENAAGNMLNDKNNWVAVNGAFVANGGEQYITIGNFRDDASTVKQYFGGTTINTLGAYYYIDDVYVGTTPPPVSVHENEQDIHNIKLYPNPNNGVMTLECNLLDTENGKLTIYDITGKLIRTYTLANGTKKVTVDAQSLEAGIYLYDIIVNGKKIRTNKLTIIK